jgi:hypothetical protein
MHKTQMAGMQITHGRHKADARTAALPLPGKPLHRRSGGNDSHVFCLANAHGDITKEKAASVIQRGWE